jgi:glycosyltransferase involved in cell wall biosynthesis
MAIRVLNVLNFSNRRNPRADSGIQLQKELITAILRKRSDFFFYFLVPHEVKSSLENAFRGKNVQLIPASFLARQQGGAYQFDVRELSRLLELDRIDVDALFINQPELTPGFLDFFNKVHFFDVHSFGYVHWMDWRKLNRRKNRWNLPGNLAILTSILLSAVTGCNSRYGKQRILQEAAKWFNPATLAELDSKLVPLWPGINWPEIRKARTAERYPVTTVIFPFRAQTYTGFKSLVQIHLAKVWQKRRDFRLIVTNPSDYDYVKHYAQDFPFIEVCRFDRAEYLRALWMADIVVACHTGASQWSLAVVEAIATECIPLLNKEGFLPEVLLQAIPARNQPDVLARYFYFRDEFGRRLEAILDNLEEERRRIKVLSRHARRFYDWDNRVDDWIRCLELADRAAQPPTRSTPVLRKIERLIARNHSCSKEAILRHLDWHTKSRHICWTRYRNHLRRHFWEDPRLAVVVFADNRLAALAPPRDAED